MQDTTTVRVRALMDAKNKAKESNLSMQMVRSRRGVQDWRIDNTYENMIQDELTVGARLDQISNNSGHLLTKVNTEQPAVDPIIQVLKEQTVAFNRLAEAIEPVK